MKIDKSNSIYKLKKILKEQRIIIDDIENFKLIPRQLFNFSDIFNTCIKDQLEFNDIPKQYCGDKNV